MPNPTPTDEEVDEFWDKGFQAWWDITRPLNDRIDELDDDSYRAFGIQWGMLSAITYLFQELEVDRHRLQRRYQRTIMRVSEHIQDETLSSEDRNHYKLIKQGIENVMEVLTRAPKRRPRHR